jgi:(E)-4-hydroxy-3-methylbut-2-enyl-diphosphate synthase
MILKKFINETEVIIKDVKKTVKNCRNGLHSKRTREAKEADLGIAGGDGKMAIFSKGKVLKTVER